MGLVLVTPPSESPLTMEAVKRQLDIGIAETRHDSEVQRLALAVADSTEQYTRRAWMTQTWRLTLDVFPDEILLPRPPTASVSSLKYLDLNGTQQTLSSSSYRVVTDSHPCRISPAYGESWPDVRPVNGAIEVTYVAGYSKRSDVPPKAVQAMLLMCKHWFENTGAVEPMAYREVPQSAGWLLDQLRDGVRFGQYGITT